MLRVFTSAFVSSDETRLGRLAEAFPGQHDVSLTRYRSRGAARMCAIGHKA